MFILFMILVKQQRKVIPVAVVALVYFNDWCCDNLAEYI